MTHTTHCQGCQPLKEKLSYEPNKIIAFFDEDVVRLTKFCRFEKYLAKHEAIPIYRIMKTALRYEPQEEPQ
jgi:hypothetical protein